MTLQTLERLGEQRPSTLLLPQDRSASSGPEAIELAASAGLFLDEWQAWYLTELLSEQADGRWSAFEAALCVPRQNGKNSILEALELAAIYLFGERLIIHSAHQLSTATEHFLRMQTLIEGSPELLSKVARNGFVTGNGKESIRFKTGQRIKFVARSKSATRGYVGDRIILDEAQSLDVSSIGSMVPSLATKPYAQVVYMCSAPMLSSTVLHSLILRAQAGEDRRLLFAGWLSKPGVNPLDREVWRLANPSLGKRISYEFVETEQRSLISAPIEFARERLGVPEMPTSAAALASLGSWGGLVDIVHAHSGPASLAVSVSPERLTTIAAVQYDGVGGLGLPHLEIIKQEPGLDWVVPFLVTVRALTVSVSVDMTSEAVALVPAMKAERLKVREVGATDVARASMAFDLAVSTRNIRHRGDPLMTVAMLAAAKQAHGQSWRWVSNGQGDVAPLTAATLALFAAQTKPRLSPFAI